MPYLTAQIGSNYQRVLVRIASAASKAGRKPEHIKLVVVSKGRSLSEIQTVYELGHRDFGENRAEEGCQKARSFNSLSTHSGDPITWHMIGHVQGRKAKTILSHFHYLHALDSTRLADRLTRPEYTNKNPLPVLLQCNVSGEESKHGFVADNFQQDAIQWNLLTTKIEALLEKPTLSIRGLMTMAPLLPRPEQARPSFHQLRALRDKLALHFPMANWPELSMGMTDDFDIAIEEGATMIRVGTAIFGQRPSTQYTSHNISRS